MVVPLGRSPSTTMFHLPRTQSNNDVHHLNGGPLGIESFKPGLTIPSQPYIVVVFRLLRASAVSSVERISSPTH